MLGRALPLRNKHTGAIEKWFGTCTDIHEAVESRFAARRTVRPPISQLTPLLISFLSANNFCL